MDIPASIGLGQTEEEAIRSPKEMMLSDYAQEDLAKALRLHSRKFPLLRRLRPSAVACIDVVFTPKQLDDLREEITTLLERTPDKQQGVTPLLEKELATLQELLAKAAERSLFIVAHLE